MARIAVRETGIPFKLMTPVIPHIAYLTHNLALDSPHCESTLLGIKVNDREAGFIAPATYLGLSMAMGVPRMVPVKVHVVVLFKRECLIPIQLGKMPVDETLDIVTTGLDTEVGNVFQDFDFSVQLGQCLPKASQRA
jgi:hypothetical protein